MSLVEINWSPSSRQLRQFGLVCLIAFPLLVWSVPSVDVQWVGLAFGIACILAGLAFLQPRIVLPLFVALILITAPIGMVVGELAMLLIYFLIFLPIGLLFRLMHRDALQLRIDRQAESYWQSKPEPKDISSYYRRY